MHTTQKPIGFWSAVSMGIGAMVGSDILTKAYNLHRNLDEERVSLIEAVLIKPH